MKLEKRGGKWLVTTDGGYVGLGEIREVPREIRRFTEQPLLLRRWQEEEGTDAGRGVTVFTQFEAGDETFTIQKHTWIAAKHPSASVSWEAFFQVETDNQHSGVVSALIGWLQTLPARLFSRRPATT